MAGESKPHVIFTYGTLKRGFPNYHLMQSLIDQNDAVFLGPHMTLHAYPLVCGAHGIPFLINLPGSGFRVTGDLYSVSTRGLVRVDELEGTRLGHYERLPVQVIHTNAPDGVVAVQAEAYYAHRSFGEGLWERNGRKGMSEYTEREARGYVRREDRPKDRTFLDEVRFFLCSDAKNDSPLE
jgi:gamma-glutamylaminecyclotransferase